MYQDKLKNCSWNQISINIYTMARTVQVEMNTMYIDMGVNSGSEKWTGKNTAVSDTLIKAVYVSYVYVYFSS